MKYIIESFFWGIIAALGALIFELAVFIGISFGENPYLIPSFASFFSASKMIIVAAAIEETLKFVVILKRSEKLPPERIFLINSLVIGIGFFAAEFAFWTISESPLPQLQNLLEIAALHIGTAGLIGFSAAAKDAGKKLRFVPMILMLVFLHASYNYLTMERLFVQNVLIYTIMAFIVSFNVANLFRIGKISSE